MAAGACLKDACVTLCCTYPSITFRCQRISHPGAKPGSRCLDCDGITDARQFATCCKDKSEMATSAVTPLWVFNLIQTLLACIYFKSKWICLKDEGVHVQLVAVYLHFSLQDVLYKKCLLFTSHMQMPVLLWKLTCEEVKEVMNRKGRASVYSASVRNLYAAIVLISVDWGVNVNLTIEDWVQFPSFLTD